MLIKIKKIKIYLIKIIQFFLMLISVMNKIPIKITIKLLTKDPATNPIGNTEINNILSFEIISFLRVNN